MPPAKARRRKGKKNKISELSVFAPLREIFRLFFCGLCVLCGQLILLFLSSAAALDRAFTPR
jgi:hypothetical protein